MIVRTQHDIHYGTPMILCDLEMQEMRLSDTEADHSVGEHKGYQP